MAASKWRFGVAGVFLFGGAMLANASGCVEAEARFYIERVCTPDLSADNKDPTCDNKYYVPAVDGAFTCLSGSCIGEIFLGYGAGVRTYVYNGMASSFDNESNNNKVETSDILLTEYIVEVSDDSGTILAWTTPSNGVIPPTDPGSDERSEAAFIILTNDLMNELDGRAASGEELSLIVGLELHGRTTGGLEVETPMTYFPLYLYKE